MQFTNDQITAIIGSLYLDIVNLRMENAALAAKLKELEPPTEPEKKLEAVK